MKVIEFIGEGPSPHEVDSFYRGLHERDMSPPIFIERYEGEYASMYRANGYEQLYGVHVPIGSVLSLGMAAMRLPYIFEYEGRECLFGPLIIEERVVKGGFAWWRQKY